MIYNTIDINSIEVRCFDDGSISWNRPTSGSVASTFGYNCDGYRIITILNKNHKIHRLIAAAFMDDFDISMDVDHIDGDKANNRPSNLRQLTERQNCRAFSKSRGGTSKYRGVSWYKNTSKWVVQCRMDSKAKCIGYFDNEIDAARAWDKAATSSGYLPESLNFKTEFRRLKS